MCVCVCVCVCVICSVVSNSLWPHGLQPTRLLCPWSSPGKNTGVGCHFLFQGIFPTQGWYLRLLCLLHWLADSLLLSHLGSPFLDLWLTLISSSYHLLSTLTFLPSSYKDHCDSIGSTHTTQVPLSVSRFLISTKSLLSYKVTLTASEASLVAQMVNNLPATQETWVQSLGRGRSPGEGNGYPLQYSCSENSMDREAWWTTVHGVAKNRTRLSD